MEFPILCGGNANSNSFKCLILDSESDIFSPHIHIFQYKKKATVSECIPGTPLSKTSKSLNSSRTSPITF